MDGRLALTSGSELKLNTKTGYTEYTITKEIGRGGSCIVYDASYEDNIGNHKLVRIKECYPHGLKLHRGNDGELLANAHDQESFTAAKERMIAAYQKNHELFSISTMSNAIANTSNIYQANGTVYIVTVYMNGSTFTEYKGKTLHDCVSLLLSAARVLKRIHEAGYLYLDLKPENILTIEGSHDLVQLFDFDSMVEMETLRTAVQSGETAALRTSYTKGYAPLELQTGRLKQIGIHSDLYSLGAVLFEALFNQTPTAFDCDFEVTYDYSRMTYPARHYQDGLLRSLTDFFHHTLASYWGDRYQTDDAAIAALETVLKLSDETSPWLCSTPIQPSPIFYGRENELLSLDQLLSENAHRTVSLHGMGGIGKSTLVRQYISHHTNRWDAVVWLYDQGNLTDSIADDTIFHINTVSRTKEESTDEYVQRKLAALSELAIEQRILIVLDNFEAEHIEQLASIRGTSVTLLLISREKLADGLFPSLKIEELEDNELAMMFSHYSGCDMTDPENLRCFETIMGIIDGHTLLTELLARQVAKSYLDLQIMEAMVCGIGLRDIPDEKIDYVRDESAFHDTLLKILDRLVEIDQFTAQDRQVLKLLSLFNAPGIEGSLFKRLAELHTLDFINDLETSGWLKAESGVLYLHPMMQGYVATWPWQDDMNEAAQTMMRNLYEMIRPAGKRHDGSKQFPSDYGRLYHLLWLADQMVNHTEQTTEASQRLLYRLLMDAPVDQDASVLFRMLDLLEDPKYLDDDSILRLYENAAYFRARLYDPETAVNILKEMKRYLRKHPSAYYLSAYHRAMVVILHNADEYGNLKKCLQHEDKAIAAVRMSRHPDAKKQLAACLIDKATTLLSANLDINQAQKLIEEARPLIEENALPTDYESYQYHCTAAMCLAMEGNITEAENCLKAADEIAFSAPDSDLSIIEHLLDQHAPIRIAMEQYDKAIEAVQQALEMCSQHEKAIRYRETRFDALLFLGRIYAMKDEYIKAEEIFSLAETYVEDSPYEWKLPLCPEDIREKAEEERGHISAQEEARIDQEQTSVASCFTVQSGECKILIPDGWQKLNALPDDPDNLVAFGIERENTAALVRFYPLDENDSWMPFDHPQDVIDGIHSTLNESQGLIEVKAGTTKSGKAFIYSIVKTGIEPSGVQYTLTMHIKDSEKILNVQGFFGETGTTGMRDTIVFSVLQGQGLVNEDFSNWTADPYDPNFKRGRLRNLSEGETYDTMFPGHPLSILRAFINTIVEVN